MGYLPAPACTPVDIRVELETGTQNSISGIVSVGFTGRYDGISINTQVLGYSGLLRFCLRDGKPENAVGRLFVPSDEIHDKIRFEATPEFEADSELEVKVRASIIEQHKEIESASAFAKLAARRRDL